MVIYQVGHYGFLIKAMVHKETYHKREECVFLLDQVIMNPLTRDFICNNCHNFNKIGKIILYDDKEIIESFSGSEEENEQAIENYFDFLLKKHEIELRQAKEIYSIFDTFNAFGVYLSIKEISFNMIEGVAFQCQSNKRYFLNGNYKKYDDILFKHKALSYDCKNVKKLFCAAKSLISDKPYMEYQSDIYLIKNLDRDAINELIEPYKVSIREKTNINLLILSSGWIIGELKITLSQYFYLYKKILDYYIPSCPTLIKPHPNADFSKDVWKKFFPNCDVLPGYFPAILIEHIEGISINHTYSTSFTAIDDTDKDSSIIPFRYFYSYKLLNKLYFAYSLGKFLDVEENNFFHYGMHNDFLWSFQKEVMHIQTNSVWSDFDFSSGSYTIIDDINWNKGDFDRRCIENMLSCDNDAVIVFFNTKNDYIFMDRYRELSPYVLPVHLKKVLLDSESEESLMDEIIYVFCKSSQKMAKIKGFSLVKFLGNTGILITAEAGKDIEKNEINMKLDYLIEKINK